MEDRIEHSLKELLVTHSQVVFPGFGAFKAIDIPAMIDSQNNIIYPPRRKVNYDPSLTEDDGLLISHYARQERISRESAEEQVNTFVAEIKHSLNRGKGWVIEDLGKFIIDGMNNLIFFPDPDQNFIPQSFGLPEVEIQPEAIVSEEPEAIAPPAQKTSKKAERSKKSDKKHKAERPEKEKKKGSKAILFLTLFLLAAGGGAYYFLFQTAKGKEMYASLLGHKADKKADAANAKPEELEKAKPEEALADTIAKPAEAKPALAQYAPRKTKTQFETPDRLDIEPTGLDQFVKAEKLPEPKASLKIEDPKLAAKTESKPTAQQKVAAATPIVKKGSETKKTEVKSSAQTKATSLADKAKTKKESDKKSALPPQNKPATKSYGNVYAKYQVVASSSMEIDAALAESEKLRKRGYNSAVLNFPDGSFKVCVGRSETQEGAQAIMQKIRSELGVALSVQQY